jgi:colanic acid biosynthesis protein WcaH
VFGNDAAHPDTHYVVLAYRLDLADAEDLAPHGHYRWWRPEAIRQSAQVHGNTQAYLEAALYDGAGRARLEPGTPDSVPSADAAQ